MRKLLFLVLFCLSFATGAEDLAVTSKLCRCESLQLDKLEGPGQINFGAYNGSCLDTCRFRKSSVLASKSGKYVISNYMHLGKYWTAEVPKNAVKNTQVAFEEFLPGIYHVFLIFHFIDGQEVRLKAQDSAAPSAAMRTASLVISPEGIPPKAGKYNLFDAYMERYPIGIRALSREQVIEWSVEKLKHPVQVYDLALNQEQANKLMKLAIESVEHKSFQVKYGLFSNNCATNVLDLIDTVIAPDITKYPIYYGWLYGIERALPVTGPWGTFKIFLSRNLLGDAKGRSILD